MEPTADGPGYIWPKLEVRASQIAGNGVFAKEPLQFGTVIPIVGRQYDGTSSTPFSHGWVYDSSRFPDSEPDMPAHNGHPSLDTHKGVGSFGLAIAMMLNEDAHGVHNCVFMHNCVVVSRCVGAGEELTVYYGDAYEPIRQAEQYAMRPHAYYAHEPASVHALLKFDENMLFWYDVYACIRKWNALVFNGVKRC
jgi:hypothetical protein